MREPSFRRSRRAKQQRLLRTALAVVVLVAVAALLANLAGDDEGPEQGSPERPRVRFDVTLAAETDARRPVARKPLEAEGDAIRTMLDDWYQRAFVEFPTEETATFDEIAAYFAPEAQAQFREDVESFTIGQIRQQVARVTPERAAARVTVFFEDRTKPRLAVAAITFRATAHLREEAAQPVAIEQRATLHLKKTGKRWVVAYYTAHQDQKQPEPATPTPS